MSLGTSLKWLGHWSLLRPLISKKNKEQESRNDPESLGG